MMSGYSVSLCGVANDLGDEGGGEVGGGRGNCYLFISRENSCWKSY